MLCTFTIVTGCNTARAELTEHARELSQPLKLERPRPAPKGAALVQAAGTANAPPRTPATPAAPGCPEEMVRVGNYCIDRYEAVLVERADDGSEIAHPAHDPPARGVRYEARCKPNVLPQAYICQVDADAACRNAGKRLCSVREWYTACRGSKRQTYPYGPAYQPGRCNSAKPHLLGRWFGNNARAWTYDNFNNPKLDQEPGFLSPTGEYRECTNSFGTFDMVGNLHEWVADRVDSELADEVHLVDGVRAAIARNVGHGIFMGGFFSTTAEQGPGCDFLTLGHEPKYHDYSTGFRCCKNAEQPRPAP